jgi:E3 ubiquitin-protein ligase UBR7
MVVLEKPHNLFLQQGWRNVLCKCPKCIAVYASANMSFLVNPQEDVIIPQDENANTSILDAGLKALDRIDRGKEC